MLDRELSDDKNILDYKEIPRILIDHDYIVWSLPDVPSYTGKRNEWLIELLEYYKGKELKRTKLTGTWKQTHQVGIDTSDFNLEEKKEYCFRLIIYIKNNRQVIDNVFIKLR